MRDIDPPAIISSTDAELAEMTRAMNAEHAECVRAGRRQLEVSRNVGRWLLKIRKRIPHGQWQQWLRDNAHFSLPTARRHLHAAKNWDAIQARHLIQNAHNERFGLDEIILVLSQEDDSIEVASEQPPADPPNFRQVVLSEDTPAQEGSPPPGEPAPAPPDEAPTCVCPQCGGSGAIPLDGPGG